MLETQDACRFVFCFTLLVATDIDVDKDNFLAYWTDCVGVLVKNRRFKTRALRSVTAFCRDFNLQYHMSSLTILDNSRAQ